ncbi:MAG: hypothetical protein Q8Q09_13035 [Deltaproteobacteria bacterium]|nr:hypothetical protein [Deltaproteobacteria bacterium]
MKARTVLALSLLALSVPACASRPGIRPSSPFSAEHALLFDDSVDYLSSLDDLGGRLAADFTTQLNSLSRTADLVAVCRIETVTVSLDPDGSQSIRLTAAVTEILRGTAPEERRVSLRVAQGQPGYNTVSGRQERLQTGSWILFVKWYTDSEGALRAHWHLSPQSPSLERRVREAAGLIPADGTERVVLIEDNNSTRR